MSKSRVRGRRLPSRAPCKTLAEPALPPSNCPNLQRWPGGARWGRAKRKEMEICVWPAGHACLCRLPSQSPTPRLPWPRALGLLLCRWAVRIYPPLTQTLFGDLCAGPSLGGIKCPPSIKQSPFGLSSHDFLDPSFSNKRTHHWMPVIASLQEFCRTTQIYFQPPD